MIRPDDIEISMLEISHDIPFISETKLRFLIWDKSPQSLEGWNWSEGLYCFFQTRNQSRGKEARYGNPLWGIHGSVDHIEYPFYLSSDANSIHDLIKAWSEALTSKTIIVLTSFEEEQFVRLEFAKMELVALKDKSWEKVAKQFNLIGESYLALNDYSKNKMNFARDLKSNFSYIPPIIIVSHSKPVSKILQEVIFVPKEVSINSIATESITETLVEEMTNLDEPGKVGDSSSNHVLLPVEVELKPKSEKEELAPSEAPLNTEKNAPELSSSAKTQFSIQLKMMGVISVLFILTVSTIIFFASYFFRNTSELQLRDNNIRMAEIVGLKVRTDVLSAVEKGRQIAITLTSQGLSEQQKNILLKSLFSADKEFIYLGIYEKKGEQLINKKEVFNEEELKQGAVTEGDFHDVISRNSAAFSDAFAGQAVLINSSPGFQEPSFAIAIPAAENGDLDNILIMIVKLSKIIGAFEKKGIETTFFVNGSGVVIAHPKEDLVLAANNLSSMPIVKSMLTSAASTGQNSYLDPELKTPFLGSFKKIGFADTGVITIVSEDKAFEAVYNIQKRNLYIMGIGLCSALIIVFFFSKTITKPILQLLTATLEIARGNFKIGIKPTTKDEIGLLTEYFIEMGQGLEEREKVKNILGSMIDPVVVQEAMVDLAALKRGSETNITAFFSDVAGFSAISEQLKSADLAAVLNEYLSAMTLILKKHEGVLDKYIGDAIVGIFSAPVLVVDHQIKAARASVEMMVRLEELRNYWTKNNLYTKETQCMDARIGLNSGLAKVGFMGTDALASYTMMGDTVNLAARLEAAGKDYGVNILITDAIQSKITGEMLTRNMDLVRVKGKNEPVRIHELIGFKSEATENLLALCSLYEEGFASYLQQNWEKAISFFTEAEKAKGKSDKPCHVLIDRCEEYKKSPPGKEWDGVFTRTHK